ncbi:hypothetical protein BH09BAC1_BH09BAC1_05740 [soil metagenome]
MQAVLNKGLYLTLFAAIMLFASCAESYQKVLKSTNFDYKLQKANEYYDKAEYAKAIPIYEELIPIIKGTKNIDEVYFKYAMSHYREANFLIAGFHFKNISDNYALSPFAEESLYMFAQCQYEMSAEVPLDQTYTDKAIDAFQLYINSYPNSTKLDDCNLKIAQMRRKLELKALEAAELYLRTQHYKAAAVSFANILVDFPDTKDAEKISFNVVKSYYLYAANSITSKQKERYENVLNSYKLFFRRYPNSVYLKDAEKYQQQALEKLESFNNPVNKS